jgi:hypothetical protein
MAPPTGPVIAVIGARGSHPGYEVVAWTAGNRQIGYYVRGLDVYVMTGTGRQYCDFGAIACTAGNNLIFATGRLDPGSWDFWHEYAHIIQMRSFECVGMECRFHNDVALSAYNRLGAAFGGDWSRNPYERLAETYASCMMDGRFSTEECEPVATGGRAPPDISPGGP